MIDTHTADAPGIDRSSTGFRLATSLVAGLVWTAVLIGAWALQSPSHTQITGFVELEGGGFERVLETTKCNNLFATEARDESVALPDFEFGFDFSRAPCEKLHSDSRIIFVMNAVVIVGLAVAWTLWFLRWRRRST